MFEGFKNDYRKDILIVISYCGESPKTVAAAPTDLVPRLVKAARHVHTRNEQFESGEDKNRPVWVFEDFGP